MTRRSDERWFDVGVLLLRLGFGLGFLYYHGWSKLTGGPKRWEGIGSAVEHLGIRVGHTYFGFLAAVAELVGGLCIAAGFLFRPTEDRAGAGGDGVTAFNGKTRRTRRA